MAQNNYFSVKFLQKKSPDENDKLIYLDQTKLPLEENYIETDSYERISLAIEKLEVRGAPLIGICAAYALALSIQNVTGNTEQEFNKAYERIKSTRPTAVNLFFAINLLKDLFESLDNKQTAYEQLLGKAKEIHEEDKEFCRRIGIKGLGIFKQKSVVLTHCNTGRLATGGEGTAFSVIKTAFENGLVSFVFADETRPLLQGLRLTAYELDKCGIPFSIQSDSSAAVLMEQKKIDFVITGADRIALNGDSANKIGTYSLALLSYHHNIPFYIAAPSSTIDRNIASGKEIEIEYRNKVELLSINDYQITLPRYDAFMPAFDVTPAHLITGIITEEGVFNFPYNFLK
jgi:methylthioribose-1-phosphate isomerase